MPAKLIAGSRESKLALVQTQMVMDALRARFPDLEIELKTYKTQGDLILDKPLSNIGDKGLFVKELEQALLQREIDFAVHSMKDMPSEQPDGLSLIPFGQREVPVDALVCAKDQAFMDLPSGSVIGTSSLRRQALLRNRRPDLKYEVVRGNVQTRLRKLDEGAYDALVLAAAGLHRLDLQERITQTFSVEEMLPACCQGTLGVEFRTGELQSYFEPFIDRHNAICTEAERAFLKTLEGGCQVPMAAFAQSLGVNSGDYHLQGLLCEVDGSRILSAEKLFTAETAKQAGESVAQAILEQGGRNIILRLIEEKQRS